MVKMKICKVKGCNKNAKKRGCCELCYRKKYFIIVPRFSGKRIRKGIQTYVYTNGVTKEIKPLIPKIKENVFKKFIKNPRKYLDEINI